MLLFSGRRALGDGSSYGGGYRHHSADAAGGSRSSAPIITLPDDDDDEDEQRWETNGSELRCGCSGCICFERDFSTSRSGCCIELCNAVFQKHTYCKCCDFLKHKNPCFQNICEILSPKCFWLHVAGWLNVNHISIRPLYFSSKIQANVLLCQILACDSYCFHGSS